MSFLLLQAWSVDKEKQTGWKAGTAWKIITPEESMWMAGYASREHPSEGRLDDLRAKVLALEDNQGNRAVLITADLIGFPDDLTDSIRMKLKNRFGLSEEQVILNSSHTHSGPVIRKSLADIYPIDAGEWNKIERYSDQLEEWMVELTGKAIGSMKPAILSSGNGVTRFQVNRRNNNANTLTELTELKGPNDYSVPVLKVTDLKGKLKAVAFGYACHPTVLSGYDWSADYPGYARSELERLHPRVVSLFFQGAGADQNPLPRRSAALARQYGTELAAAVERVLNEEMKLLSPKLITAYQEVEIYLDTPLSVEKLEKMADDTPGYMQRWAARQLNNIRNGCSPISSYSYPLQLWRMGEQSLIALGGEVVVDYSMKLKQMLGNDLFVMGCSNDVMSYIPSERVLREGGYEGETSQMAYGMPARWKPGIEAIILGGVARLAGQTGLGETEELLRKAGIVPTSGY